MWCVSSNFGERDYKSRWDNIKHESAAAYYSLYFSFKPYRLLTHFPILVTNGVAGWGESVIYLSPSGHWTNWLTVGKGFLCLQKMWEGGILLFLLFHSSFMLIFFSLSSNPHVFPFLPFSGRRQQKWPTMVDKQQNRQECHYEFLKSVFCL